ncbi:MAG: hypothetical protein DSY38_05440 [Fusobacteria bacterium]|nr:MAG: hypothetical protein DSY38_05440 [Fusobacteriota bacterium]
MQTLQVDAIEKMENDTGFTKHTVDGIDVYVYNGLELTDEVEIRYLYSIPLIGTVLSSRGIRIKD